MKKFTILVSIMLLGVSCSSSSKDSLDDEENIAPLVLKVVQEKQEANIYEIVSFKISTDRDCSFYELNSLYDSICWKMDGSDESFSILDSVNFTPKWSNNFFLPKKHEISLIGYKDDKATTLDTQTINITNKHEFLGFDWKDITKTSQMSTGYFDAFDDDIHFFTFETYDDNYPSVYFSCYSKRIYTIEEELAFNKEQEKILSDYMTKLYNAPKFDKKDEAKLISEYNSLFVRKKAEAQPKAIWITSSSKIVLLQDTKDEMGKHWIHAEPIKIN